MVLNSMPTIQYEGRVVGGGSGYSSLLAELARGRTFSAQVSASQVLRPTGSLPGAQRSGPTREPVAECEPAPAAEPGTTGPAATAAPAPPGHRLLARADLSAAFCPPGPVTAPGGPAAGARGTLTLVTPGEGGNPVLQLQVQGLRPLAPGQAVYALWLLYDLPVSPDLPPEDLALLPRGPLGTGNAPGCLFTLDGQPPVQGPGANTVTLAIPAGTFAPDAIGAWDGSFPWTAATGWTTNPALALGSQAAAHFGAGLSLPIPSGMARAILSDVFLRRASRFVHLPLHSAFPQRLLAATQEAFAAWDADRSGSITSSDVAALGRPDAFLDPLEYGRAVITVEPVAGRMTPALVPTAQACALAAPLLPC